MAAGKATRRIKVAFADKRPIPYENRNGTKGEAKKVTIGTIFTDPDGNENVAWEAPALAALKKAYGAGADDRVFFDVYPEDGPKSAYADKTRAKDAQPDW